MDVASLDGWHRNMDLVLDFYNTRRRKVLEVAPNPGHLALVELEKAFDVTIITQNVDDLHERAGSSRIVHLHGELLKSRSSLYDELVYDCTGDIKLGDLCERGSQLRPHIVWFGEPVPMMEVAAEQVSQADVALIIGTSMQVYPAAGLIHYAPRDCEIYYIDPRPQINFELAARPRLRVIAETAGTGVPSIVETILKEIF